MTEVNGIFKFGHIHHSKGSFRVFDANIFCIHSHVIKKLAVIWVFTALHFAKVLSRGPPCIFGKNFAMAQVFER